MSVIIIDDDKKIVELYQELLESEGIEILGIAHDGKNVANEYEILWM